MFKFVWVNKNRDIEARFRLAGWAAHWQLVARNLWGIPCKCVLLSHVGQIADNESALLYLWCLTHVYESVTLCTASLLMEFKHKWLSLQICRFDCNVKNNCCVGCIVGSWEWYTCSLSLYIYIFIYIYFVPTYKLTGSSSPQIVPHRCFLIPSHACCLSIIYSLHPPVIKHHLT